MRPRSPSRRHNINNSAAAVITIKFADWGKGNGGAENARPENDGQRKLRVWKMQDWKMTDKILANSGQNYGVWKMQEYKSSWVQPTHTVYIKEAVRGTLQLLF